MLHVLCCFAQQNFCFFDALVTVAAVPCILNSLIRAVRSCYTAVIAEKLFILSSQFRLFRSEQHVTGASYLVPIMWTKYLSVLTIISTRQCKHFRPPSFSKLRRNTDISWTLLSKKKNFRFYFRAFWNT